MRLDYNLTSAHRLTFTTRYNMFRVGPRHAEQRRAGFPGFPNSAAQNSDRFMWQGTVRSTLGKNMVNEARVGWSGAHRQGHLFFYDVERGRSSTARIPAARASGARGTASTSDRGVAMIDGAAVCLQRVPRGTRRRAVYEDTLTWLKGKHSISIGGTVQPVQRPRNYNAYFAAA